MNSTSISYNPRTTIIPRSFFTKMLLTQLFFILSFRIQKSEYFLKTALHLKRCFPLRCKALHSSLLTCIHQFVKANYKLEPVYRLILFQPDVASEFNDSYFIIPSLTQTMAEYHTEVIFSDFKLRNSGNSFPTSIALSLQHI